MNARRKKAGTKKKTRLTEAIKPAIKQANKQTLFCFHTFACFWQTWLGLVANPCQHKHSGLYTRNRVRPGVMDMVSLIDCLLDQSQRMFYSAWPCSHTIVLFSRLTKQTQVLLAILNSAAFSLDQTHLGTVFPLDQKHLRLTLHMHGRFPH